MPLPDGGKFLTICAFVQITIPQCDGLKETVKQLQAYRYYTYTWETEDGPAS